MRVSRLFVEQLISIGEPIALSGPKAHYIGNVLRSNTGDEVVLFNGEGGEFTATITSIKKSQVNIIPTTYIATDRSSKLNITLGLGITKRDAMDNAIQKATELGVTSIQPIVCDFTTVSHKSLRLKNQHWQNICHSACEQSSLNIPPTVHKICTFEQWIGAQKSLHIIANPVSTSTFSSITTTPESLAITIGPEGGFSAQELTLIANSNVTEINMGHRILRADTASIAIVSLCQQKWGDL